MSISEQSVGDFLQALGARSPAPGGGAAAAMVASLAAGLARMVAQYTEGMEDLAARAGGAARGFLSFADRDAAAFAAVAQAYRLPREGETARTRRRAAIREALRGAAEVPLRLAEACADAGGILAPLAASGNRQVLSDVLVAACLLRAAVDAAAVNVQVNLDAARGADWAGALAPRLEAAVRLAKTQAEAAEAVARDRMRADARRA